MNNLYAVPMLQANVQHQPIFTRYLQYSAHIQSAKFLIYSYTLHTHNLLQGMLKGLQVSIFAMQCLHPVGQVSHLLLHPPHSQSSPRHAEGSASAEHPQPHAPVTSWHTFAPQECQAGTAIIICLLLTCSVMLLMSSLPSKPAVYPVSVTASSSCD